MHIAQMCKLNCFYNNGDSVRFSKADGIRNDHYTIHLGAIVLAVEDGDESLDIKAE